MMEKRRFGRTGHLSTAAIFGAAAFWEISQADADQAMDVVLAAGLNHIDVAPSYGQAELRLGPWLERERDRFFLGCKTMERSKSGAWAELRRSLELLHVERFDLYQFHAVSKQSELDEITAPGGALEAFLEARQQGLIGHIGITGHGVGVPALFLEALRRFDFDSVLFPINFIQYANPEYRRLAEELLRECQKRDIGVMVIKSVARAPWGDRPQTFSPWYEPFAAQAEIDSAVRFALSQPAVTGLCTVSDVSLLPLMLDACERFTPLTPSESEALIARAGEYEPLFS
jgi:aryl-alcohol dehydrogenase-like predicted oxidoreductase